MIFNYDLEFIPDIGEAHTGKDFGFILEEYPVIPNAELVYNSYEIPGRDGELVEAKGYRKNILITPTLSLIAEEENQIHYNEYIRNAQRWLFGSGWVRFSDLIDTKFRVLKIYHDGSERETPIYGRISPSFLCEPYEYKVDGFSQFPIASVTYNPYDVCKPIYRITGEKTGTLTVNGNPITINVGQNLTIDTAKQITYRSDDDTLVMSGITGNYEDMWLDNGNVSITITSGLTATVEPRWGWLK